MVIAIDIVLIPSTEVIDLCLSINKKEWEVGKGRFKMSRDDYIPHVSLAMGFIEDRDLDSVKDAISRLMFDPFEVRLVSLDHYTRKEGKRAWFTVDVTSNLRDLHTEVFNLLKPYLVTSNTAEGLYDGDKTGINETSQRILNEYVSYSYDKYNPHVTLCCYDADTYADPELPVSFMANEIAVYQLGDGCTCRKRI